MCFFFSPSWFDVDFEMILCVYIDTDTSFRSQEVRRDSLLREIGAEQQRRLDDANARTRRNTNTRKMMISKNIS